MGLWTPNGIQWGGGEMWGSGKAERPQCVGRCGAVTGRCGVVWVPLMGRCGAAPQAIFKMIPEEERLQLPEDENSPQKRADKLWAYFNKGENGETHKAPQTPMGPHKPHTAL